MRPLTQSAYPPLEEPSPGVGGGYPDLVGATDRGPHTRSVIEIYFDGEFTIPIRQASSAPEAAVEVGEEFCGATGSRGLSKRPFKAGRYCRVWLEASELELPLML